MAFFYYTYDTTIGNTIVSGSTSSSLPLPSGLSEIYIDWEALYQQPVYLYRISGGTAAVNTQANIDAYMAKYLPPDGADYVVQEEYTGFTETTVDTFDKIASGVTEIENSVSDYLGVPQPTPYTRSNLDTFNLGDLVVSGYTSLDNEDTRLEADKIDKVTGATGNLAIFKADGNVEDTGISIDSITGGTGYYYYQEKVIKQTTTSLTDVVYLSASTDSLQDGVWSVDWNGLGGNTGNNKGIIVGFYLDNVLQGVENRLQSNASTNVMPFVITKDLTFNSGIHIFEIRFRADGGGTAFLDYGAVRARIVN